MGQRYDSIQAFQSRLYDWSRALFLKERMLANEMSEVILEAVEGVANVRFGEHLVQVEEVEDVKRSADLLIVTRMFNDFESAKLMLLYGLPDQAYMPMRDTIECMMMLRLIYHDRERAKRWMTQLKEYSPGNVKKRLEELGIEAPEYAFYGFLSELAHLNMVGALGAVAEIPVGEKGVFRRYNFGGFRNERWILRQFRILLSLEYMALVRVIGPSFASGLTDPRAWSEKVVDLFPRLKELDVGIEVEGEEEKGASPEGDRIAAFVKRKLTFHFEAFSPQNGETTEVSNAQFR